GVELTMVHYPAFLMPVSDYIPFAAFVMAAFSALRLAKFNLDERQSMGFIGLPTPANALFWGSFILGWRDQLESSPWALPLLLVLILLSCYLLIAEIPMFALKFKHWGWAENQLKYIFILCCIPILLVCGVAGISLIIVWYILVSVYKNFTDKLKQQ
uniref:CDP-alcohol phosphatidyltransferase family protein n=1 Tax=Prevotella sp. TaxID=59823 RepID=UPI00402730BD